MPGSRIIRSFLRNALYSTLPLARFLFGTQVDGCGAEYQVGLLKKLWLVIRFLYNTRRIETWTSWVEHLVMADELLRIPRSLEGHCIELGCYKGGSTANLSIACA